MHYIHRKKNRLHNWWRKNAILICLIGTHLFAFWCGWGVRQITYKAQEFEVYMQEAQNQPTASSSQQPEVYHTQFQFTPNSIPEVLPVEIVEVLSDSSAKTYMNYKGITDKTSPQWDYIFNRKLVTVDDQGYLVTEDGYIGVALGSYFGDIGEKYIFELSSGKFLKLVKIEAKDDRHTDKSGFMANDGSVIEFVVDTKHPSMQDNVWQNGLIWQGNFNNNSDFEGTIVNIWRVAGD